MKEEKHLCAQEEIRAELVALLPSAQAEQKCCKPLEFFDLPAQTLNISVRRNNPLTRILSDNVPDVLHSVDEGSWTITLADLVRGES